MRGTSIAAAILIACFAVAGCTSKVVVVVDAAGKPVQGAAVTPVYPSFNGTPIATDKNGQAAIPQSAQEAQWVDVAKSGYVSQTGISVNGSKRIKVVLQKAAAAPQAAPSPQ